MGLTKYKPSYFEQFYLMAAGRNPQSLREVLPYLGHSEFIDIYFESKSPLTLVNKISKYACKILELFDIGSPKSKVVDHQYSFRVYLPAKRLSDGRLRNRIRIWRR